MYNNNLENLGFTFSNPIQKFFMAPAYASMLQMNPGLMSTLQNNAASKNLGTGFTPRFYQPQEAQYQPYNYSQPTAYQPTAYQPAQSAANVSGQFTPYQFAGAGQAAPQYNAQGSMPYGLLGGGFGNYGGMGFSPQTGTMQPTTSSPATK